MKTVGGETGAPWTDAEIEATVATYFQMLRTQELGQALNKAEHNRRLQARIPARSRGAIEFKHANISAVLMEVYDAPPLRGLAVCGLTVALVLWTAWRWLASGYRMKP
mgnify:CR=1 FL=1